MTGVGLPEGTPILCRNCGGAMELRDDASILCRYCGARDALPGDELGRVLEIKRRLAQAEARALHVRGFDGALAAVFEDPRSLLRVTGAYLAFGLFVVVVSGWQFYTHVAPNLGRLGRANQAQLVIGQLMAPVGILGLGVSFGVALRVGRHHYRKGIRPLLLARPPAAPNLPFACRACGGNLPSGREGSALCPYCSTSNLLPRQLHGSYSASLQQEAEAAREQLQRAQGSLVGISARMRAALVWCVVVVLLLAYALPMAIMAALD